MRKMLGSLLKAGAVCGMLMVMNPFTSLAAIGPGFTAGTYIATITAESVNINKSQNREYIRSPGGYGKRMDEGPGQ